MNDEMEREKAEREKKAGAQHKTSSGSLWDKFPAIRQTITQTLPEGFEHEGRSVKAPEDWLFCALLRMVLEHCARGDGTYDSFERRCNTEALRLLAEAGFFHIDSDIGDRIRATAVPKLDAFLAWMGEGTSTSGER